MVKILVVVDMQNDFINGSLGTPEARAIVDKVCAKIQTFDGRVFVTQDTHGNGYLSTQEGRLLPVEHCIKDSYGWKIQKDVSDALREWMDKCPGHLHRFEKSTFGWTSIADTVGILNCTEGVEEVEFIGLCTDICVVSNAIIVRNLCPEVNVSVDAACCAGTTPEMHRAALEVMKSCQIHINNKPEV